MRAKDTGVVAQRSLDASDEAKIGESLAQANKPRPDSDSSGNNCGSWTGLDWELRVWLRVTGLPGWGGGGVRSEVWKCRTRRKCEFPATDSREGFGPVTLAPWMWPCPQSSPVLMLQLPGGLGGGGGWGPMPAEKVDGKEAKWRP